MSIEWLKQTLLPYAHSVPLGPLAFVAAFFEELIPPIPGFTLMVMIGSFARIQDYQLIALFSLTLFSALGKTLGAQIIYRIVDKVEDVALDKFGRFLNITHEQIENFGKKLGHGPIDYVVLTALRALPIVPGTLITVGSGIIRVPQRLFIISTFIGSIFRDGVYLYVGYVGVVAFEKYFHHSGKMQIIGIVLIFLIVGFVTYFHLIKQKK